MIRKYQSSLSTRLAPFTKALGELKSPGREVSSEDVPMLPDSGEKGKTMRGRESERERETSASPLPSFGTKNVRYSSCEAGKERLPQQE